MWRDGVGGGMTSAMEPMLATLKGLGVGPRLETRGQALKMNDAGEACGVYAETKDGVLEINAKAVIFSGGGWAASPEMLATYGGYDMDKTDIFCCEGCVGDTLKDGRCRPARARTRSAAATCSATPSRASRPATSCSTIPHCG